MSLSNQRRSAPGGAWEYEKMNKYPANAHDLVGKTKYELARMLGPRASGFTLFLGPDSQSKNELQFARLRVDLALLERIRDDHVYLRERSGSELKYIFGASRDERLALSTVPDDIDHEWSLHITQTSFWVKAVVEDDTAYGNRRQLFSSICVQTLELLKYLDATLTSQLNDLGVGLAVHRNDSSDLLAPSTRSTSSFILATGDEQSTEHADKKFFETVTSRVPEVQAEFTAAVMRARVAEHLTSADSDESPSTPPRRRRMNA
jgi:hypothetical protein